MPARPEAAVSSILSGIALAILTTVGVAAAGDATVTVRSYFTAEQQAGIPSDHASDLFDCTEQIFAVIEIDGLTDDQHLLEIWWKDPNATVRETNNLPFPAVADQERLWAWLKLHQSSAGALAAVFDRAATEGLP